MSRRLFGPQDATAAPIAAPAEPAPVAVKAVAVREPTAADLLAAIRTATGAERARLKNAYIALTGKVP